MKTRKVLEIRFPDTFTNTMFRWDGYLYGYTTTESDDRLTVWVPVQRRRERSELARVARMVYGATTRTLVH